tara:strand:+ start:38086 stop:39012 length:927 start_codon:yes stop_codon:yes gene_type:complete
MFMELTLPNFRVWLTAARLRTLPLSFSGIITGTAMAMSKGFFNPIIFILALWCTFLFQVISNFANDYGDGIKGTDNNNRVGPKRVLQSGLLSAVLLKKAIIFLSITSFFSVLLLLCIVFGSNQWIYFTVFSFLGGFSIWAAIRYTVGDHAYGYKGLGDLFVFLFFGLLGVIGSQFLFIQSIESMDILPALVIGCLSVAVLNLNNMRDHINDRQSSKNTLVVKFGYLWAKKYHSTLILVPFFASFFYSFFIFSSVFQFTHLLTFIPLFFHLYKVLKNKDPKDLDHELKKVALLTFLWSILFLIASNYLL